MREKEIGFDVGEKITVCFKKYTVEGFIVFSDNSSGSIWREYKLLSNEFAQVRWLSIDLESNEFALYEQLPYNKQLEEKNTGASGYREVDSGTARVTQYKGAVDVVLGDIVRYKEFEDSSEENIISIEDWEDEKEYSRGYYISAGSIRKDETTSFKYYGSGDEDYLRRRKKRTAAIVIGVLILVSFILSALLMNSSKTKIAKFLATNNNFAYSTSITSDLDNSQKADVYSTTLSIEEASKLILEGINGKIVEVQENKDDGSVAILTDYEYCFIYKGDDMGTLIQISSRLYTYSSNNSLYHGNSGTFNYYRRYYYTTGYSKDRNIYSNKADAYRSYAGGFVDIDLNDKYRSYSSTVRQSSTSSRSSQGGGISLGK